MKNLIFAFLKMFSRNLKAMVFVIFLPLGLYLAASVLGIGEILRFAKPFSYNDFLLTGVMAFALMQTGIYTVTYTFIDYHRSKVLKRLAVTPVAGEKVLLSQAVARYFLALIQVALLLVCGILFFHTKISPLFLLLLPVVIFFGNTLFLSIGFIIASFTRDYEQAAPYTMVIGTILMFLGDAFFPIENLPRPLLGISEYLPLKPLVSYFRFCVLGIDDGRLIREGAILLAWFVVVFIMARLIFVKRAYR